MYEPSEVLERFGYGPGELLSIKDETNIGMIACAACEGCVHIPRRNPEQAGSTPAPTISYPEGSESTCSNEPDYGRLPVTSGALYAFQLVVDNSFETKRTGLATKTVYNHLNALARALGPDDSERHVTYIARLLDLVVRGVLDPGAPKLEEYPADIMTPRRLEVMQALSDAFLNARSRREAVYHT